MNMKTLLDLYLDMLKDTYDAEKRIAEALPDLAEAVNNPDLKAGLAKHLDRTEDHIARLEQAFEMLGKRAIRKVSKGMMGLLEDASELIEKRPELDVLDAGLIALAQKVEHYQISAYGTLITYADSLGENEAIWLFLQTLQEEKDTDEKLSRLAEGRINLEAAA